MIFSKELVKKIATLGDSKGRRRTGLFVAEGTKCVCDLSGTFKLRVLLATEEWLDEHADTAASAAEVIPSTRMMLGQVTRLTATPSVVALFELPAEDAALPDPTVTPVLALDRIQDPGNLGTIVRTCDWMGIRNIVASKDTVDVFNPKVVQASMGAISTVKVCYTDLSDYLGALPKDIPVYGTFLGGEDVFATSFDPRGVIVMGNEGSGIGAEVAQHVSVRLTIPAERGGCAESLNVASATAMLLALRRKSLI